MYMLNVCYILFIIVQPATSSSRKLKISIFIIQGPYLLLIVYLNKSTVCIVRLECYSTLDMISTMLLHYPLLYLLI